MRAVQAPNPGWVASGHALSLPKGSLMKNDEWWAALFSCVNEVRRIEGKVSHEQWPQVKALMEARTAAADVRAARKLEEAANSPDAKDAAWLRDLGIGDG